jgi:hypothetical protein
MSVQGRIIAVEEPAPYLSASTCAGGAAGRCNAQAGLAGRPKQTRLVEIRMTKTTLYLTEQELAGLLSRDPVLWKLAIRRGKGIKRA